MPKAIEPYKRCHLRLVSGGPELSLETLAGQPVHSAEAKRQAARERTGHFFTILFQGLFLVCVGPLLVGGGVFLITLSNGNGLLLILGLLLAFGLGLSTLGFISSGFRGLGLALHMIAPVHQRDLKEVVEEYRNAIQIGDFGRIYLLTAPRAVNGLTPKALQEAWRPFVSLSHMELPEEMLHKLKAALEGVRQPAGCHSCGTEKTVHRSGLLWLYKGEDTPVSLIECPDCDAVYCRECFGKLAGGKCAQCGADLKARQVGMLYQDREKLSIRYVTDKKTANNVYSKTVLKKGDGSPDKLLDMQWEGYILLDNPPARPADGKNPPADGFPRYSDIYLCIIHLQKRFVNIGGEWYMAEAMPPTDCTVDWEELHDEAVAPVAKQAGAEIAHTAS